MANTSWGFELMQAVETITRAGSNENENNGIHVESANVLTKAGVSIENSSSVVEMQATTSQHPHGSVVLASAPIQGDINLITIHHPVTEEASSVHYYSGNSFHPSYETVYTSGSVDDVGSSKRVPEETEISGHSYVGSPKKRPKTSKGKINKTQQRKIKKKTQRRINKVNQRKLNKTLRMAGKSYIVKKKLEAGNVQATIKPPRSIGLPCVSKQCAKVKTRKCNEISENARSRLFRSFWEKMDWHQRKVYICSLVEVAAQKRRRKKAEGPSRRGATMTYYLKVGNEKKPVCLPLFLSTFGLKETCLRQWLLSASDGMPSSFSNCETLSKKELIEESKTHASAYLDSLPKMPSYYCQSANSNKSYLEPIVLSKRELYRIYNENCDEDGFLTPLSEKKFLELFETKNLALFQLKSDQCDACCAHKAGHLSAEGFKTHEARIEEAKEEKTKDKGRAKGSSVLSFCMDMQFVKLSPLLKTSAMYCKAKLCVHNFTFYNLADKSVHCYWWNEVEGGLVESVFASFVTDFIAKQATARCKEFIIYSDGSQQNRNAVLSNVLLKIAKEKKMEITQKFLERKHTQMEVDGAYSVIERKLKNRDIYLPSDYVKICKEAWASKPYTAEYVDHKFFSDFTGVQYYPSTHPLFKVGDPTATDVVAFKYSSNGEMHFKLRFTDEWNPLPGTSNPGTYPVCPLYTSQQKITKEKYEQLQELKSLIPSDCHSFYDNLPHDE